MVKFDLDSYDKPLVGQTDADRLRDVETLISNRSDDFAARMREEGYDYTVDDLSDTPAAVAAETAGFGDAYFLGLLDETARAVVLPSYAEGSDLDLCVARSGTERLDGETDAALRERDRLNRKGKSAAGPDDYYKAAARAVDSRVIDAAVSVATRDFSTRVLSLSILTGDNDGVPDEALLASILAVVNASDFKSRNVVVEVVPAVIDVVDVVATLYLYPDAVEPSDPAQTLRDAFDDDQTLGFDLTESYVVSKLMGAGVQRVVLTGWADHYAAYNQALALGNVTISVERVDL